MAFDPTKLLDARMRIEDATNGKLQNNRLRIPTFEATKAVLQNAPGLIPNYSALKQASEQPVKIPVYNSIAAGNKTARQCSGSGTGTTAWIEPTYQGITEEFHISELEHAANLVGRDAALAYLISQKSKNIYARIENIILAFLEANVSETNAGTYFGALTAGNSKQATAAQEGRFFAGILAEMMANNYRGALEFIASYNLAVPYNAIAAQGSANNTNQAYQVLPFNPHFAAIADDEGVAGTAYVFEEGSVGLFDWINPLHRKGVDIGTDVWTTFDLPLMPGMTEEQRLTVELKVKKECKDNSATITGGEADYVEGYVMHIDISPLVATDDSIFKYELLEPEAAA